MFSDLSTAWHSYNRNVSVALAISSVETLGFRGWNSQLRQFCDFQCQLATTFRAANSQHAQVLGFALVINQMTP